VLDFADEVRADEDSSPEFSLGQAAFAATSA